ncbi:hypothetical protein AXX16_3934 [Serratia rubidaea]|nr:hypothetical protein AXX16_3934 [Serratia rubidaea]
MLTNIRNNNRRPSFSKIIYSSQTNAATTTGNNDNFILKTHYVTLKHVKIKNQE